MKKVAIHFYSAVNLGDDLFVKIIAERYRNIFYVPYRSKKRVYQKTQNILTATSFFGNLLNRVYARLKFSKSNVDLDSLRAGEILLYVGGSIFIEGDDIQRWGSIERFFLDLNKPYYILGSNIGPYKSERFLNIVRRILSAAVDATVRDGASHLLVNDLNNVRLAPDMVFSLDTQQYITEQKKMVVFSLIDAYAKFEHLIARKYEDEICRLTELFLSEGYQVTYMSFCRHEGDEKGIEQILERLPVGIRGRIDKYFYRGDLEQSLRLISSASVVVGTRFHATILGLLFGKKVLPIAYSDKMLNVLNDIHFNGMVLDIRDMDDVLDIKIEDIGGVLVTPQVKDSSKHFEYLDHVLERST